MNSWDRVTCSACGVEASAIYHRCASGPVMADRAGNPIQALCPQAKFDEAIRGGWPEARAADWEGVGHRHRLLNDAIRGSAIGGAPSKGGVVGAASGANVEMERLAADARRQINEITDAPPVGGKLKGDHYYRVDVKSPISDEIAPYLAECADIIEALGMSFNEGEAFKAIWRLAAARTLGKAKGTSAQYDADKAAHYAGRVAAQIRADDDSKKGKKP